MGYNTIDDIVDFINHYYESNGKQELVKETDIAKFVKELQQEIAKMKFSLPEGTIVIAYTGTYNDVPLHTTAKAVAKTMGDGASYISNLPAGELLNDKVFQKTMKKLVGEENLPKILSGYTDDTWTKRLPGGSCGFGENLLSLDDFVSKKLMGETKGANSNIIVLTPAGIDVTKVFATTELDQIFNNITFDTINGIPKGQLQAIYKCEPAERQAVYDILTATAKEEVGNTSTMEEQVDALMNSNSILVVNLSLD